MQSAAPPHAYRPGLDAVRAVAILLVIIGHWTQPPFPISLMGSMTFFVLSGYFISGIVWKQEVYVGAPGRWQRRLGVFYLRRLVRTLPPYYLSLAASFLESNQVVIEQGTAGQAMAPADLADQAKQVSVLIRCE